MRGHADRGQATREQLDVTPDVVRGPQVHEPPLNRRFAEEHRGSGRLAVDRLQLRSDEAVLGGPCAGLRTAPRHLHDTVGGSELSRRLRERSILHHEPPGQDCCKDGGARNDAEPDQPQTLATAAQSCTDEAQRERDAAERRRHRWMNSTGV